MGSEATKIRKYTATTHFKLHTGSKKEATIAGNPHSRLKNRIDDAAEKNSFFAVSHQRAIQYAYEEVLTQFHAS